MNETSFVVQTIHHVLSSWFEQAQVHSYGSSVSGFADACSDLDLSIEVPFWNLANAYPDASTDHSLASALLTELQLYCECAGFEVLDAILKARVPMLRLRFPCPDCFIDCDITVNNILAVYNTRLLQAYAENDRDLTQLVQSVKKWSMRKQVHGARDGHLNSYAFALMAIFYLQVKHGLRSLQDSVPGTKMVYDWITRHDYNVAFEEGIQIELDRKKCHLEGKRRPEPSQLLAGFFCFFSTEFRWGQDVVSVRTGLLQPLEAYPTLGRECPLLSTQEMQELIHIEEPFQNQRNLNFQLKAENLCRLRKSIDVEHSEQVDEFLRLVGSLLASSSVVREKQLRLARAKAMKLKADEAKHLVECQEEPLHIAQ